MTAQKQLFIDDQIIEEERGVCRTLNQPAKYGGNPILNPIYPWEGRVTVYGTVTREPGDGLFRLWYQGYGGMGIPPIGSADSGPWKGFDAANLLYTIGYATSKDGIFWERSNLGLVEFQGSKDNNLVLRDAAFANVIRDERDPDPSRLYKSLFFEARDPAGTPNMGDGVSVAFSPDGLRWTKYAGNPGHPEVQRLAYAVGVGREPRQVRGVRPPVGTRRKQDQAHRPGGQ